MMVRDILNSAESKMKKTLDSVTSQLAGIRTGKVSAGLVDGIKVDVYGQTMPLKQVGTVSARDSQTLVVQVWDKGLVSSVEKAIRDSNMGLSPASDGQLVRIGVPPLSEERRKEYVKLAKKYSEEAKVSIRNIRRDAVQSIEKSSKEKLITEDDLHKGKKDADNITHKYEKIMDELVSKKEKEIMEV